MAALFSLSLLCFAFSIAVKSSTTSAAENTPVTEGTTNSQQLQGEHLLGAPKTSCPRECLATETVTRELSAMRLKLLAMEFDLQATKAELREIKGTNGSPYLQKLASDINSKLDLLKSNQQTLIQGMAEQKQEFLHTLNAQLAEKCDHNTTLTEPRPSSCQDLSPGQSGAHEIWVRGRNSVNVYCDGEWTVFQRRQNGNVNFYRDWNDYKNGFGNADDEFWLGLESLHQMTSEGRWELRVDLGDWDGSTAFATYSDFLIADETDGYRLRYGNFTGGTAGDSLNSHNGMKFTTLDRDFDTYPALNCARRCHGAWWYQWCHTSNLNGDYKKDGKAPYVDGMTWTSWKGNKKSLKFSQMKIRRI